MTIPRKTKDFALAVVLVGLLSPTAAAQDSTKAQDAGPTNHSSRPSCRYCPSPEYPPEARKAKIETSVVLEIVVTEKGKAKDVRVVRDPGNGFASKAVDTVKNWKFNPAKDKDGKPVAAMTTVEVVFRLLN